MKHAIPEAVLQQHIAFLGKTGSGKTSTAKLAVEQILRDNPSTRVCVLDPIKSDWWGLTSSADGKKAGLPFHILGGPRGHVALHDSAGKAIGELVAKGSLPLSIIDMADFGHGGLQKFFNDFAPALLKHMRGVVYLVLEEAHEFCLSEDTEILTKDGFRPHSGIEVGTEAVCFDTKTSRFSYGPIERVLRRGWSGEMVRLQSDGVDSLSTPDHRVVLRRVQRGSPSRYKLYDWTFCQAENVPTCVGIPIGGAPVGPGVPGLTLEEARILGWIITDGNLHPAATKTPRLMLSQSMATTKMGRPIAAEMDALLTDIEGMSRYDRLERVSTTMGRSVRSGPSANWYFGGESSLRYIELLDGNIHRVPRKIIEQASRPQLEALYEGLLEGDGTSLKGRWVRFYPGHNGGLADDFQEIALRLGIAVTKQTATSGQWIVNIASERRMNWVRKPSREHYDGTVWDVTVPTGAFVARRNGKVFVTGNCPKERSGIGAENLSIHYGKKLATAGRSKGIRLMVITQRTQALHNALLGSCDTMIAHRLTAPADQEPVKKWLKANVDKEIYEKVSASMSSLKTGSGWICSGEAQVAELVQFPKISTYDNSATPTGDMAEHEVRTAPVDAERLRAIIGDAVKQAEDDDPKRLRAEIARLTALTKTPQNIPHNIPDAGALVTAEQRGYVNGFADARRQADLSYESLKQLAAMTVRSFSESFQQNILGEKIGFNPAVAGSSPTLAPTHSRTPVVQTAAASRPSPAPSSGTSLPGPQQRILDSLATWRRLGTAQPTNAQVAWLARYSPSSTSYTNPRSALNTAGLIEYPGRDCIALTDAGNAVARPITLTGSLLEFVLGNLPGPEERILRSIAGHYPRAVDNETAATGANYSATSTSYTNPRSALRTKDLIDYPGKDQVRAADWLFAA